MKLNTSLSMGSERSLAVHKDNVVRLAMLLLQPDELHDTSDFTKIH